MLFFLVYTNSFTHDFGYVSCDTLGYFWKDFMWGSYSRSELQRRVQILLRYIAFLGGGFAVIMN